MYNFNDLPNAYKCAIECLGNGDRTIERLQALCNHFAATYGLSSIPEHPAYTQAAWEVAKRRYYL